MTPAHPLAVLVNELVKAVAAEVVRIQREEPAPQAGFVPVAEIARRVGRHHRTVKAWMRAGVLPRVIVRGRWYCPTLEFEKFLASYDGKRRSSSLKRTA